MAYEPNNGVLFSTDVIRKANEQLMRNGITTGESAVDGKLKIRVGKESIFIAIEDINKAYGDACRKVFGFGGKTCFGA